MSIRNEIERAAELKGRLVDYAQSPGFATALRTEMAASEPNFDEVVDTWVDAVERLIYVPRDNAKLTFLERYLKTNRQLSPEDREALEGWRDRNVNGLFQVVARRKDKLTLMNLIDELSYETYSTMGAAVARRMPVGSYVQTRIVPIGSVWTISGHLSLYSKHDHLAVGSVVAELAQLDPTAAFRNPEKLKRALEINRRHHEVFCSTFGSHVVKGTGREAAERYREHFRAYAAYVAETFPDTADSPALDPDSIGDSEFGEMIDSDDVAIFCHPVKGISFYAQYAEVEGSHRLPPEDAGASGIEAVRSYLDDETVPAYVMRGLAEAFPDTADELYRIVLERSDFCWRDDGEALLRERKPASYADNDIPDLVLLPEIALKAMRGVHGRPTGAD